MASDKAGDYKVTVTNAAGSVTSGIATISTLAKNCSIGITSVPDGSVATGYVRDRGTAFDHCSYGMVVKKCHDGVWDHPEAPYWSCTNGK